MHQPQQRPRVGVDLWFGPWPRPNKLRDSVDAFDAAVEFDLGVVVVAAVASCTQWGDVGGVGEPAVFVGDDVVGLAAVGGLPAAWSGAGHGFSTHEYALGEVGVAFEPHQCGGADFFVEQSAEDLHFGQSVE